MAYSYCEYLECKGAKLFSVMLVPEKGKKFPIIVIRSPYVDGMAERSDGDAIDEYERAYKSRLSRGYAVAIQHCRGCGKSSGDCIPYINEHDDSNSFYNYLRSCDFYMGELYLQGESYLSSVHLTAAPYANDIKAAVLEIQDSERYNIIYRNGFLKVGLHGDWYVSMYKKKTIKNKNYTVDSFLTLPLSEFSTTVFGEHSEDFDEVLNHPSRNDEFWSTHMGGSDARGALNHADIPILLRTGFYDIYTGGVFDMWNAMDDSTRSKSALIVTPNDHGDSHPSNSMDFKDSKASENFPDYIMRWFDHVRGTEAEPPVTQGKITYYRLFENCYAVDNAVDSDKKTDVEFGSGKVTYVYNPYDVPAFKGGLSANFGGTEYQDSPNSRYDIISNYTQPFAHDVFIKGKMSARLCVSSDCEDTCFYVRISIEKPNGDLGLRDDIRSLCFELGDYTPNSEVTLDFSFDEHAFKISKGERLRIDVSSASRHYVRHTNVKGLYSTVKSAKIAHNTVNFDKSFITLPIE